MTVAPRKLILIADDDKDIVSSMELALVDKFNIIKAHDGATCLMMVMKNMPDLILLDITMPRMSGYQVIDAIKRDPKLKNIPIVFVTAKTSPEDVNFGHKKGAVEYLTKPFELDKLISTVDKLLAVSPATS